MKPDPPSTQWTDRAERRRTASKGDSSASREALAAGITLRAARTEFFSRNGMAPGGGYRDRWVKLGKNRLPVYLMNTPPRRRAVPFHDLHHVLTEYDTSLIGESEIAAWELAAGTRPHWMAAILDLSALAIGLFIAPRRTFRAFVRGRHSRSLYAEPLSESLLSESVASVRERLGLHRDECSPSALDAVAFATLVIAGPATAVGIALASPVAIAAGLLMQLLEWRSGDTRC